MSVEEVECRSGLKELVLTHGQSRVRLSLQGAHITEYRVDEQDLLWLSQSAQYSKGVSIRGGIPLCWPWFGASQDNASWPQHGFARTSGFRLVSEKSDTHCTSVVLALDDKADIHEWQGAATLEVELRISDHLWMELRTTNGSENELLLGAALHSYFLVSDHSTVSIPVLTGLDYLDKTDGFKLKKQADPLKVQGEIDRVYVDPPRVAQLIDDGYSRTVEVESWGNSDLVVWNPGRQVAASMADFDSAGYQKMVCIEPAIALDKRISLWPGETYAVGQTIRCFMRQ